MEKRLFMSEGREGERHERRGALRFPFIRFVRYQISSEVVSEYGEEERDGALVNVSEGGACIFVNRPLEEGQFIKVEMPLPNVEATTGTLAEVKWIRKIPWLEDCFFAGLHFLI